MKRHFQIFTWIGIFAAMAAMVACGKSNTNSNTGGVVTTPPPTTICPPGSTQNASGLCIDMYGQVVGGIPQFGQGGNTYAADNYQMRNLTVTNTTVLKNFLKNAMGVCDRAQVTGGVYDCSSWTTGYLKVAFQGVPGSNVTMAAFYAYPSVSPYYWYGYQAPNVGDFFLGMLGFPVFQGYQGIMRNPLPLQMNFSLINNSQGFETRAYGDLYTNANRSLIQIIVSNGKLGDQSFNFQIGFEGTAFMSGTFYNCGYGYCGY